MHNIHKGWGNNTHEYSTKHIYTLFLLPKDKCRAQFMCASSIREWFSHVDDVLHMHRSIVDMYGNLYMSFVHRRDENNPIVSLMSFLRTTSRSEKSCTHAKDKSACTRCEIENKLLGAALPLRQGYWALTCSRRISVLRLSVCIHCKHVRMLHVDSGSSSKQHNTPRIAYIAGVMTKLVQLFQVLEMNGTHTQTAGDCYLLICVRHCVPFRLPTQYSSLFKWGACPFVCVFCVCVLNSRCK